MRNKNREVFIFISNRFRKLAEDKTTWDDALTQINEEDHAFVEQSIRERTTTPDEIRRLRLRYELIYPIKTFLLV